MISTKDLSQNESGNSKTLKTITPGEWTVKINKVELSTPPYDQNVYHLVYHVEGPDMGPEFEGFLLDPSKPNGPRYKGQIGRVNANYYGYKDAELPSGTKVKRDQQILRAIYNLCVAANKASWLDEVDNKYETIEQLVLGFNEMIKGTWLKMVIAGKEYENKQGYINYQLFLPKPDKGAYIMELPESQPSKLMKFNEEKHVKKIKKENVESFGNDNPFNDSSSDAGSVEFDL